MEEEEKRKGKGGGENYVIFRSVHKTGDHHVKQNKPDSERQMHIFCIWEKCKIFKELTKLCKLEMRTLLPFCKASITLISQQSEDATTEKENCKLIFLMNIDT